jgi:predicted glycoside hydrolase/deacetylase ChbG (UPF0249 family)
MTTNPFLEKLGFTDNDRAVIIHTDDIGMCHASVQAFKDLWEFGTISSGATMVPCPWFPAVAQMCRENPDMDMGVHATLNAEWQSYRWGPISTREASSGLMDESGYFHQWQPAVYENAQPDAVEQELNAQIEKALAAGIDITHVDSHMGTIMNPKFIQSYVQAASSRLLPSMLPRLNKQVIETMEMSEEEAARYIPMLEILESMGIPMIDAVLFMPLNEHSDDHIESARKLLGEAPVGITHLLLHPSVDTPELRAIAPDWVARVANYNAFMSDEMKKILEREAVKIIGYGAIRDVMRKANQ